MITRPGTLEFAKYVIVFTTRSSGSTADVLRSYRMRWQIGVSRQGHINQSVRVRPRLKDSGLVAGEAPMRNNMLIRSAPLKALSEELCKFVEASQNLASCQK
jgi:hypothetical protein